MSFSSTPVEIFCCYAREDEVYCEQLETHLSPLKREGLISLWHDQRILPGTNWPKTISTYLEAAQIILLLISADFIASDYCYSVEMKRALERHRANEARVVPIIVRPCNWQGLPIASLQALPKDAKAITEWHNEDAAFEDITKNIRIIAKQVNNQDRQPPSFFTIPRMPDLPKKPDASTTHTSTNAETPLPTSTDHLKLVTDSTQPIRQNTTSEPRSLRPPSSNKSSGCAITALIIILLLVGLPILFINSVSPNANTNSQNANATATSNAINTSANTNLQNTSATATSDAINTSATATADKATFTTLLTPTPTPTPTTTVYSDSIPPSGNRFDSAAQCVITSAQTASSYYPDTFLPQTLASTFQTGEPVYLVYQFHSTCPRNGLIYSGSIKVIWYVTNNKPVCVTFSHFINGYNTKNFYGEFTCTFTGNSWYGINNAAVEIYVCQITGCFLARIRAFTIQSTSP